MRGVQKNGKKEIIIFIFNLMKCGKWRGICILLAVGKKIAQIFVDLIPDAEQTGFRSGSSCVDHSMELHIAIPRALIFASTALYCLSESFS